MNWKKKAYNHIDASYRFIRFIVRHFIEDDCAYIASALAFTCLLAVVPLMSVGLAVFSTFPVFQELATPVQNFIFEHLVPTSGKQVETYLLQFTSQVSKLSIWGMLFLLITSLLVMFTIEQAMNKIWRVSASRKGVTAFLLYWSILSLAPIMLGLSLLASSYLLSIPILVNKNTSAIHLYWTPFFLSMAGFIFLYMVVPNCKVKFIHAFWGGLFASISFEAAKQTFAYYLTRFDTYELLYGAFAAVPILFIWVYWVWIITLLGAEISYALSVHHQRRNGKNIDGFSLTLIWLYQLWLAQQKGKSLSFSHLINICHHPFAVDADQLIKELLNAGLILTTVENEFSLSRDLTQISLYKLYQMLPYKLPAHLEKEVAISQPLKNINDLFTKQDKSARDTFKMSLEELFTLP